MRVDINKEMPYNIPDCDSLLLKKPSVCDTFSCIVHKRTGNERRF